ncbi:MAG TPA: hypothetical protein ENG12_05850 [Candidatus Altiarchaeales archaeon]|nr:hypothetical protein [Candidatus Altiarchaeales archaeon]
MDRVGTGISGLDRVLGGGLPSQTVILVSGGAGTGKTLFGLNFIINGAIKGEKCCYVSLGENKDELLRACDGIEKLREIRRYIDKNLAIEHVIMGDNIDLDYFTNIFASYPMVDRLVIDNVNRLLIFAESSRDYRMRLSELVRYLKKRVNCTLLLCETNGKEIDTGNGEAFECDGVLNLSFLEFEERPKRILEIHKLRYSSFEPKIPHEFIIDSKGLRVTKTRVL